jgi:excisionase family DNA binding protein
MTTKLVRKQGQLVVPADEKLLSIAEAATYIRCSKRTVYYLLEQDRIAWTRSATGKVLILQSSLVGNVRFGDANHVDPTVAFV